MTIINTSGASQYLDVKHFHLFCGLGGGAKGFNKGHARVGNIQAKFRCLGGIDNDAAAIRDFNKLAGVPGTVMDLFSRDQYIAFHGHEPPIGWREATPADIRATANGETPDIVFTSSPCKGLSGLLSETKSKTGKYQALNQLTVRGIWLTLEAWKNDPVPLILFENVPRIANRGRPLLDQINAMLRHYGYAVAETTHDCGELGGLAQSRKRFLLVARHMEKVPPFLYEPEKRSLRAVGDILSRMPTPLSGLGGAMHRVPSLQWKTWVRLAFVESGSDWRSLNKLRIEDGRLADYLIVPETRWEGAGRLGVTGWSDTAGTVAGASRPENGRFSVADPRFEQSTKWNDGNSLGVKAWNQAASTIGGGSMPGQGAYSVADPRMKAESAENRHKNVFRIVDWREAAGTISGGHGPSSGGQSIADPRLPNGDRSGPLGVCPWDHAAKTVAGESFPTNGEFSVADPRPDWENRYGNLAVTDWDGPSKTIIAGGKGVQGGWMSVADPRAVNRDKGDNYLTGGHYGVVPWGSHALAVSGSGCHDNGWNSVADPRMPESSQQLIAVIRALDGTWHRPFTTLELAALQSLVDPEEFLELDGLSDSAYRERIGNAVPSDAAAAIAGVMGTTLLLAATGATFQLSNLPIWVRPVGVALAVRGPQP
jgi:site-specific DNA-cytosine methylase